MSRNTSTGRVLEKMVIPAIERGGYVISEQTTIGNKINGRKHRADVVVEDGVDRIIVSLKYQQTDGTAEQKVPFEVINLIHACKEYGFKKAYIVLGGTDSDKVEGTKGWTLRKWYTSGELSEYIDYKQYVELIDERNFISRANQGKL